MQDRLSQRRALRALVQDVPGTVGHDGSRFTFLADPPPCPGALACSHQCERCAPKVRPKPTVRFPWEEEEAA